MAKSIVPVRTLSFVQTADIKDTKLPVNLRVRSTSGCAQIWEIYKPITNLWTSSKIFEKLILKRILDIQEMENVDLTGSAQHGLKKGAQQPYHSQFNQSLLKHWMMVIVH